MPMTPDAKRALSQTIRALRARLLQDLHDATESAYRLSVDARHAGLGEAAKVRRGRLQAWVDEQKRAGQNGGAKAKKARDDKDFLNEAVKQAAYTLLNRLVLLRLMEAPAPGGEPLRSPAVVTGGWESRGYRDFRELAPALVRGDETEGYAFLLKLVFEDLATELPGLFGPAGVAELVPVPASTLRHVVEALDAPELESCWTDDMTLGWVYQYWNDPEREALDAKLNSGGKVETHEIAGKTQMFTERYMVDWLLQNSLGPMWLAMCKKQGWTPEVEAQGTLDALEERRKEWREKREKQEVSPTELMPLYSGAERRWAYYVPQPIPDEAVKKAPGSLRELKLLDPAVGSGHFLVVAMELLAALYKEEARHRGEAGRPEWSDRAIAERIISHNLHGIDLDPRAVQIAAAALWLKARHICREARPERMNLVASNLRLAKLPDDDEALLELREEVERESGVPAELTDRVVQALRGADHLGSLLKVDGAVEEAIRLHEERLRSERQLGLAFGEQRPEGAGARGGGGRLSSAGGGAEAVGDNGEARKSVLDRIEAFLWRHTSGDDLGLRLRGEQLAAGVRFVRLVREGRYDLVVANPPYQGTSKMVDARYVEKQYKLGKADLYAAFLMRGLELVRDGGVSAMLTMRGWMFIKQFAGLREWLLGEFDLRGVGDFDRGAFEDVPDEVVSVAVAVFQRVAHRSKSVALCPTPRDDRSRDSERTRRKRAATLCQVGRYEFDPAALKVVPEWPLVYWWDACFIRDYASRPLLGEIAPVRNGLSTQNNTRFLRLQWEVAQQCRLLGFRVAMSQEWAFYIKGAEGRLWVEDVRDVVRWSRHGLEVKAYNEMLYGSYSRTVKNESFYFQRGVAFSLIGHGFTARIHRYRSVFGHMGASVFPQEDQLAETVCLLNSRRCRQILAALNPSVHFLVGDLNRLPLFALENADKIFATIESAFTIHESHREPSVEFKRPGPSPWRHAQEWAQAAVDRPEGAPLPEYIEELDPEPPTDHISFALGVALGRFAPPAAQGTGPTWVEGSDSEPVNAKFANEAGSSSAAPPSAAPTWVRGAAAGTSSSKSANKTGSRPEAAPTDGLTWGVGPNAESGSPESANKAGSGPETAPTDGPTWGQASHAESTGPESANKTTSGAEAAPTDGPTCGQAPHGESTGPESANKTGSGPEAGPTDGPTWGVGPNAESGSPESANKTTSRAEAAPTDGPTWTHSADAPDADHAPAIESSILDPTKDDLSHALPAGILFLDGTLDSEDRRDSLGHPAAAILHEAWATHGPAIDTKRKSLRDYLAHDFFKSVHRGMYENRPIHWPLSSSKRTFVAWVNIHRFNEQTLRVLLADHLHPALARMEGELEDLRAARDGADKKAARAAEKDYDRVSKARDELAAFIEDVEQCADRGAPPVDQKCPPRDQDARYAPDLDDGVMINSAALWPLLDPQWKDPKKWWKQLAQAAGKKDYDWSHLAMRYWPTRVDEKCRKDPSLGVAHGCFWRYHPARAWAWELRLQDEIAPDFRIEEPPYRPGGWDLDAQGDDRAPGNQGDAPHREAYLRDHPSEALAAVEKEAIRRMGRKDKRRLVPEIRILEPGLWSALPAEVWQMELRLSEKQGAEFRLLAPDEPEARAAYEAANPEQARHRVDVLAKLEPGDLFGEPRVAQSAAEASAAAADAAAAAADAAAAAAPDHREPIDDHEATTASSDDEDAA